MINYKSDAYVPLEDRRVPRKKMTSEYKNKLISSHPYCVYCGNSENLVLDHIYPVSRGGCSELFNLTVSCGRCNSHKWGHKMETFLWTTVEKRDASYTKCKYYLDSLRQFRNGRPAHYMHCERSLSKKIEIFREEVSYFTEIIFSITKKRYKIFS